jgi:phenylalanyl-tRNA synthetase beta chain
VRELTTDDLLITDAEKPIAVAGVMGGVNSEVTDETTSILLESAHFNMLSVRHTARRLKLRTDASARFERGIDPELAWQANLRAVQLIQELCPEATVRSWEDEYPAPPKPRTVSFPFEKIERVLGVTIAEDTAVDVLGRLGFGPALDDRVLTVQVPSWRSDVTIPEDVIEEIFRIVGYDTLPATLPIGETPEVERDPLFLLERKVRHALAAAGAYEARSYVTVSEEDIQTWSGPQTGGLTRSLSDESNVVRLVNPINAGQPVMRTSLVPSLLRDVAENLKHEKTVRLFETGHVYLGTDPDDLPEEPTLLALAWAGFRDTFDRFHPRRSADDQMDFFDVKGAIDLMLARTGVADPTWEASSHPALHPGRTARVSVHGERIGIAGEVRPDIAREIGVEDVRLVVAELDLSRLLERLQDVPRPVITVDHYLPVEQDFAVVVTKETTSAQVEDALRKNAGRLLTDIVLFDAFEGEQIGEGNKSLAYRLTFTAPDRALTDQELEKTRKKIEKGLKALVGGTLRT